MKPVPFSEKELQDIERQIQGEDRPEDLWFVDTIQRLVDVVRDYQSKEKQ